MTAATRTKVVALAAVAAALTAAAVANLGTAPGANGGTRAFAVTATVVVVVAAGLFGWYLPRARRAATGAAAVGVLALLSVAAFWSGLPFVLGAAAVALGRREGSERPELGGVAVVLGVAAVVLGAAAVAYDRLTA